MWNFRGKWPEELEEYQKTIEAQRCLFNQLKSNKCIHKIFAMTLTIGNILNGGSDKGQADGFGMDVIKLSKLKSMKDCKGNSLMQYICKQIVAEDDNFANHVLQLNKLFKDNMKMTDIRPQSAKLDSIFEEAKQAFLEVSAQEEMEGDDNFKSVVGNYIVNTAANEMDIVEKNTKQI